MNTNRERAIITLRHVINATEQIDQKTIETLVDTLIAAVRDDQDTPHARAVAQMAKPLDPGSYRDGVGVPRCETCHRIWPCPEHGTEPR